MSKSCTKTRSTESMTSTCTDMSMDMDIEYMDEEETCEISQQLTRKKSVSFNEECRVFRTYSRGEYDRTPHENANWRSVSPSVGDNVNQLFASPSPWNVTAATCPTDMSLQAPPQTFAGPQTLQSLADQQKTSPRMNMLMMTMDPCIQVEPVAQIPAFSPSALSSSSGSPRTPFISSPYISSQKAPKLKYNQRMAAIDNIPVPSIGSRA